jgi:hypothetical protein
MEVHHDGGTSRYRSSVQPEEDNNDRVKIKTDQALKETEAESPQGDRGNRPIPQRDRGGKSSTNPRQQTQALKETEAGSPQRYRGNRPSPQRD